MIWAEARQNQQIYMCGKLRLRSAWASAQYGQSLCCTIYGLLRTQTASGGQRTGIFVGFVVLRLINFWRVCYNEPPHDKTNKMTLRPAKIQISLGISPLWSESSLCAQWVAKDPRFLHADSEDSDQTGRMPRLIWVFAGRTCHFVGFVTRRIIFALQFRVHRCCFL